MPDADDRPDTLPKLLRSANPKYRLAAGIYLVYGVVYMTGAAHLGLTGASSRASQADSWIWYSVGAVILLTFPLLINRGFKWFCRALVLFLGYRLYGLATIMAGPTAGELVSLPVIGEVSKLAGAILFAIIATVAAGALARAAWDL